MRLKVASRKSDLARWQAVQVGRAFEELLKSGPAEYTFKSSFGDQNLDLPLASMGSKGVFTQDFYEELKSGVYDLVVHSWKDLPTEDRPETSITMTLPRADMRDVLIVPEDVWQEATETGTLPILTSSPRREYNLGLSLPDLLPGAPRLEFHSIRGNVPTRLQKMVEQKCALVMAKAALDRLLEAEKQGFLEDGSKIRFWIENCRFAVLPVSLNPPAPAQGALAVEVVRSNHALIERTRQLNHHATFQAVEEEREILKGYGGGCHQKIGVAVILRPYGKVLSLRGLTDQGVTLGEWRLQNGTPWSKAESPNQIFPLRSEQNNWFHRVALGQVSLSSQSAFWVARADAWPEGAKPRQGAVIWTAGVKSWKRLASQGIWVTGCADGLGETEDPGLQEIFGSLDWCKLTHDRANKDSHSLATYRLEERENSPDLRGKTHFFWMSGSSFERARALFPDEIEHGWHACGPGSTHRFLEQQGLRRPIKVFIGLDQFLRETLP
ncbi:MAG: hydroxymethylbilane synthase [Bdellovibrionales bacterium]